FDMDGVPGIISSLRADDDLSLLRQDINDFAFAFIAPLGAHQDCIRHNLFSGMRACSLNLSKFWACRSADFCGADAHAQAKFGCGSKMALPTERQVLKLHATVTDCRASLRS